VIFDNAKIKKKNKKIKKNFEMGQPVSDGSALGGPLSLEFFKIGFLRFLARCRNSPVFSIFVI
jgi:hypothetical protein